MKRFRHLAGAAVELKYAPKELDKAQVAELVQTSIAK
jgi:hypothetical protein